MQCSPYYPLSSPVASTNDNMPLTTFGEAQNCYIQPFLAPTLPYQYPTYQVWTNVPVMRPHVCPVCQGRETVKAGFYRDVPEVEGPQECRGCKGKGLIYLP